MWYPSPANVVHAAVRGLQINEFNRCVIQVAQMCHAWHPSPESCIQVPKSCIQVMKSSIQVLKSGIQVHVCIRQSSIGITYSTRDFANSDHEFLSKTKVINFVSSSGFLFASFFDLLGLPRVRRSKMLGCLRSGGGAPAEGSPPGARQYIQDVLHT